MKRSRIPTLIFLLTLLFASTVYDARAQPAHDIASLNALVQGEGNPLLTPPPFGTAHAAARWAPINDAVIAALASGHADHQETALQVIIRFGTWLDVRQGVHDVARLYRNHGDDDLRRMAAVALGEMKSDWAIDLLARSIPFENTPRVRRTVAAVVAAHQNREQNPALKARIAKN